MFVKFTIFLTKKNHLFSRYGTSVSRARKAASAAPRTGPGGAEGVAPRERPAEEQRVRHRGVDAGRGGGDRRDGRRVGLRGRIHARRAAIPRVGRGPVQRAFRQENGAQGSPEAFGRPEQSLDGALVRQQQTVLAALVATLETGHRVLSAERHARAQMSFEFDNTGTLWWTLLFIDTIFVISDTRAHTQENFRRVRARRILTK